MGNDLSNAPVKVVGDAKIHTSPAPARTKDDVRDEVRKKLENRLLWNGEGKIKPASDSKSMRDFKKGEEIEDDEEPEPAAEKREETTGQGSPERQGQTQDADRTKEKEPEKDQRLDGRVTVDDMGKEKLIEAAIAAGATPGDFLLRALDSFRVKFDLPDIEVAEKFDICQLFEPSDQNAIPDGLFFTLGYRSERENEITKPRAGRVCGVTIGVEYENSIYFSHAERTSQVFTSEALGYTFLLFLVEFTEAEKSYLQGAQNDQGRTI